MIGDPRIHSWRSDDSDATTEYVQVGVVQWGESNYNFDMTAVYRHIITGALFYAEDSGCSCPSPFEDTRVSHLKPITRLQDWVDHINARLQKLREDYHREIQSDHPATVDEATRLSEKVAQLLRERKDTQ